MEDFIATVEDEHLAELLEVAIIGKVTSLDDLNRWLALAMNIWNSTPQPDCGGRTVYELTAEMWDKHTGQAP